MRARKHPTSPQQHPNPVDRQTFCDKDRGLNPKVQHPRQTRHFWVVSYVLGSSCRQKPASLYQTPEILKCPSVRLRTTESKLEKVSHRYSALFTQERNAPGTDSLEKTPRRRRADPSPTRLLPSQLHVTQ